MIFRASEFHQYYQPSPCDLRVYLSHKETAKAKPSPFAEVMKTLGIRHERSHLESLSDVVDLSSGENRERRTIEAVGRRAAAVYQPRFTAMFSWDGIKCEVVGEPDFLI